MPALGAHKDVHPVSGLLECLPACEWLWQEDASQAHCVASLHGARDVSTQVHVDAARCGT